MLAQKLVEERRRNGYTQREVAEKIGVDPKDIVQWENAMSKPDRLSVIEIAELFRVSTEYLMENEELSFENEEDQQDAATEAVTAFLQSDIIRSHKKALSILLYILSPAPMILFLGFSEADVIVMLGVIIMFVMIAAGVYLQILEKGKKYKYRAIDNEVIRYGYYSSDILEKYEMDSHESFAQELAKGVAACVLSPVPLLAFAMIDAPEVFLLMAVAILLAIVGWGVYKIVRISLIRKQIRKVLKKIMKLNRDY